jgi:fermentation-respiration switch protein FrsA (DUF1100 family)
MKWFLFIVSLYVGLAIAARILAGKALYHPGIASRAAPPGFEKVRAADGNDIAVLHVPNPAARFTIWFFHGNAEALGDLDATVRLLRDAGFAVVAFDYPGYGVSSGTPNERSVYESARAARQHLRETLKVPAARTIIYGRSLGTGPAVQMASEEKCAGLVLQSPFTSVFRVLTQVPVFPGDMYTNQRKLKQVAAPLLVMHGEADEVIPFRHGQAMFASAAEPKRSLFVPRAHHNDFIDVAGRGYVDALREFSALCAAASGSNP